MSTSKRIPTVVVAGDVMIDWHLAVDSGKAVALRAWSETNKLRRERHLGGAWLLADLIEKSAAQAGWTLRRTERPKSRHEDSLQQTYTLVAPVPKFAKDGEDGKKEKVWRVKEFLGVEPKNDAAVLNVKKDDPLAELVVLQDLDLGFDRNQKAWPAAIQGRRQPWVILKTSIPAFQGLLWDRLIKQHANKMIVITTVDDLRRKEVQMIRRLSWERTAHDLMREMRDSGALRAFKKCKYTIVSFGTAGAMLLPRSPYEHPRLVFDPASMEGEWGGAELGSMIGYTSVLTAAVAHEVMIHPDMPQLGDALARGVAGMRTLFENGYGIKSTKRDGQSESLALAFDEIAKAWLPPVKPRPGTAIVKPEKHDPPKISAADVRRLKSDEKKSDKKKSDGGWTVLGDRLGLAAEISPLKSREDALYELAARIATFGPEEALREMPQLKIGKLFTVDRDEIESLRSIKGLLSEYVQRKPSKPFSIGVFGSPGSGKSFSVEEIAKSIGGKNIEIKTFNLTQFAKPADLHGAFHQVRDISLTGKIPVVFWDEFDTTQEGTPLGWLRYFIGPMQDGQFQEEQLTHPIGTSIFVFAGGTAYTKDDFVNPPKKLTKDEEEERVLLKVPDFISRLKGFLDVSGPDPSTSRADPHFPIRRAILLRSMLQKHCPHLFKENVLQIDAGVLHTFLRAPKYVYGARSMESVIMMSALASRRRFDRSSLPPQPQLEMHIQSPSEIGSDELDFTKDVVLLEELAEATQNIFLTGRKGWVYGPVRDDANSIHNLLLEYSALPEWAKEANRANVRWIPKKLEAVDCEMVRAGNGEIPDLSNEEWETLARMEHDIWMERKRAQGYRYGPVAMESPKRSPYLVAWEKLPQHAQDLDRAFSKAIPTILDKAGYIFIRKPKAVRKRAKRKPPGPKK